LSIVSYGVLSIIFLASSYSLTSFSSLYFWMRALLSTDVSSSLLLSSF
jgi:hypothetical protein